jgi:hypothetical protein
MCFRGWLVGLSAVLSFASLAQAEEAPPPAAEPDRPRLTWKVEAKAHYRDSDANFFPVQVPPQVELPPGFQPGLQTVDPGEHFEVSTFTLLLDATWGESLAGHAKVDAIDLYDRNPTSEDHRLDVDELWIRFGRASETALLPERPGVYAKVGKFAKFERQNDRHLESYGLVSTAFNRFEDMGLELGADLGRYLYVKASATAGNPVFFRDPNALAGDNGTPFFEQNPIPAEGPPLGSGVLILYDAEVEDLDVDGDLEIGAGLGGRWASEGGLHGVDVLLWGYRRKLAETVKLEGTFYGGDLDLLNGPLNSFGLPIEGDEKEEVGANVWLYWGGLSFFGQYVDSELASLERKAFEGELAYRLELPLVWALSGRQLFPALAPAVRYSKLDPDFRPDRRFPAPSVGWEWEKLDYGLRVEVVEGVDLTLEYADHTMVLFSGREVDNNELLATLRWKR